MSEIFAEKKETEKSCCFTGYRPGKFPFRLERGGARYTDFENRLVETVLSLTDDRCNTFYSGMAMGFDIIAAETVLLLKKSGVAVRLVCVLPFSAQGSGFPEPWRERYHKILSRADDIVTLSDVYYAGCYFQRNTFMVDRSDYVITWFDGKRGGTENTLRYAAKKRRCIINLNSESDGYGGIQTSMVF